jgi:hypothetical protein
MTLTSDLYLSWEFSLENPHGGAVKIISRALLQGGGVVGMPLPICG